MEPLASSAGGSRVHTPPPEDAPADYYELLGVDPSAEPEAIRKGEGGVSMMDKIPFIDPAIIFAMNQAFVAASVFVIIVLLFPIFVVLKADDAIHWSWPAVFSPAFFTILIFLLGAAFSSKSTSGDDDNSYDGISTSPTPSKVPVDWPRGLGVSLSVQKHMNDDLPSPSKSTSGESTINGSAPPTGDSPERHGHRFGETSSKPPTDWKHMDDPFVFGEDKLRKDRENAGSPTGPFASFRNARNRRRRSRPNRKKVTTLGDLLQRALRVLYIALIGMFFLLISLQLEWESVGSWWAVFAPWYIAEFFHLTWASTRLAKRLRLGVVLSAAPAGEDELDDIEILTRPYKREEVLVVLADEYGTWLLRILLALLIPGKLGQNIHVNWSVIFLPAYLITVLKLIVLVIGFFFLRHDVSHEDYRSKRRQELVIYAISFLLLVIIGYSFLALFMRRLQAEDIVAKALADVRQDISSYKAKRQEMLRDLGAPSYGVILAPVFACVGCVLLIVSCCLPCVVLLARVGIENELAARGDGRPVHRKPSVSTVGASFHTQR
ncbi:hypothetical protein HDU96_001552 [Phlyctochytrium bullatum]|nr:hypothetical protein HDU96_001552 [Phlyctochytrium bullatum]